MTVGSGIAQLPLYNFTYKQQDDGRIRCPYEKIQYTDFSVLHNCIDLHHTIKIKIPESYVEAVFTKEGKVKARTEFQEDRQEPVIIIDGTIKYFDIQQQVPVGLESSSSTQEYSLL